MGLTKPVRLEIKERSNGVSELSSEEDREGEKYIRPLICAHIQHQGDKGKKLFDNANNGLHVTDIEHLVHHTIFRENPGRISLRTRQNETALIALTQDICIYNRKLGIPDYDDSVVKHYETAITNWLEKYSKDASMLGVPEKQREKIITRVCQSIQKQSRNGKLPLVRSLDSWL
jgi:hypothetical protein